MGGQVPQSSGLPLKPTVHEGLLEPTGNDNVNGMLLGQSPLADLFLLSKTRTHLATSTESCCEKPLSSILATSRGNTSNLLEEILPANCSTLNSHKPQLSLSLKHSKDQFLKERNLRSSDPDRKDPPSQNCEVIDLTSNFHCDGQPSTRELIDLTSNCHWDGQPSRAELIVPCSSKKPKLSSIDSEISCYSSFSEISEKHGKRPQLSSYRSTEPGIVDGTRNIQHPKVSSVILLEDDMTTTKTEFKHKGVTSNPISCDDETKGSAFLIQVQEKLTIAEYKEFVGYMKALKSKAMKISYILQSIAKLFSTPERLLLLMRFKDFVPAKYRPMYEQLLGTHGAIFDE